LAYAPGRWQADNAGALFTSPDSEASPVNAMATIHPREKIGRYRRQPGSW
jgi:hypothetical protein